MKKYIPLFILSTYFASCSNGLKGKIEKRGLNEIYLINSSTSKIFRFTVKTTKITDDSLFTYYTELIELAPGEEKYLGLRNSVSNAEYPKIKTIFFKAYFKKQAIQVSDWKEEVTKTSQKKIPTYEEVMNQSNDTISSFINRGTTVDLPDTIIGNIRIKRQYIYDGLSYRLHQLEDAYGIPKNLPDTVINMRGAKFEYLIEEILDTLHPIIRHFAYEYKVTGQIEINPKDWERKNISN